jgi:ribosome-binding protein aMBF1 (putative translation factor)
MIVTTHRIVDRKAIESVRKLYCEFCGRPAYGKPHHIKTVGSGGDDVPGNMIQLCTDDHTKAHTGQINKGTLREIVRRRESGNIDS